MLQQTAELTGPQAFEFIAQQAATLRNSIAHMLADCEPGHTFVVWGSTLRQQEELFNLYQFHLPKGRLREAVGGLRLDSSQDGTALLVAEELATTFSPALAQRFLIAVGQMTRLARWWRLTGRLEAVAEVATVAQAADFFQAHRRQMVALLYAIPRSCTGAARVPMDQCLALFLPRLKEPGVALVNLSRHRALLHVFSDYKILLDEHRYTGSYYLETLDAARSEPERASLLDMEESAQAAPDLEPTDPTLVFSAAELRNEFRKIAAAYAEFNLASSFFGPVTRFLTWALEHVHEEYWVAIPYEAFQEQLRESGIPASVQSLMVSRARDFAEALDEFAPFVRTSDRVVSTIPFLSRFAYHCKSLALNRNRRFQIRSGFIFEEAVAKTLRRQGFTITGVKRIDRNEFDVVAVQGDTVFNVQCKNNLVDLWRLDNEPEVFARYNKALDRYYARALAKEEGRERMLLDRLGAHAIRHVVVSRFPVATRNPRVIYFGEIESFRRRFASDLDPTE